MSLAAAGTTGKSGRTRKGTPVLGRWEPVKSNLIPKAAYGQSDTIGGNGRLGLTSICFGAQVRESTPAALGVWRFPSLWPSRNSGQAVVDTCKHSQSGAGWAAYGM